MVGQPKAKSPLGRLRYCQCNLWHCRSYRCLQRLFRGSHLRAGGRRKRARHISFVRNHHSSVCISHCIYSSSARHHCRCNGGEKTNAVRHDNTLYFVHGHIEHDSTRRSLGGSDSAHSGEFLFWNREDLIASFLPELSTQEKYEQDFFDRVGRGLCRKLDCAWLMLHVFHLG